MILPAPLRSAAKAVGIHLPAPVPPGITFLHHQPSFGNIGDELCSPKHYFAFEAGEKPLIILGGGAFSDLGLRMLRKRGWNPRQAVLWGAGISNPPSEPVLPIRELSYLDWGVRDVDRTVEPSRFLPCVSCLHPMLDEPKMGEETLVFVNGHTAITPDGVIQNLQNTCTERGWAFLTNQVDEATLRAALSRTRHLVTNSFHGAYWGLLSGREVSLVGYSSKFVSLFIGLGLDPGLIHLTAKGAEAQTPALIELAEKGSGASLPDPLAKREEFRAINLAFAERLVGQGLLRGASPLPRT